MEKTNRRAPRKYNKKLTERQKKFCENYVTGMTITQSAIEAGYSEKNANNNGKMIMGPSDGLVRKYIKALQEEIIHTSGLNLKWFLERCMRTFDSCSELIDDNHGGLKPRDASGAAKMAAIIKDAIPDFKTRFEHVVKDVESFTVLGQNIQY